MNEEENVDVILETENEISESFDEIQAENNMLKRKLDILLNGVNAEYLDDAYKLSEDTPLEEVIKKYPEFVTGKQLMNTGVYEKNDANDSDLYLRKAFGLNR